MKTKLILAVLCFSIINTQAQLVVTQQSDINLLVNNFILTGVTATNITYTGDTNAVGSFSNGNSTNLGLNDGIILTTGIVNGTPQIGDSAACNSGTSNNTPGDALLGSIIGTTTYDASVLEFDLEPVGNILEFQYVFSSEEYPEWVGSTFNDIFGFFITGTDPGGGLYIDKNIALIPNTNDVVCINNINDSLNSNYFVNNAGGANIVFDGFTTVLLAQIQVVPQSIYHLKMAIADVSDAVYDSGIFLKAQSMKSYIYSSVDEIDLQKPIVAPNPINDKSNLYIHLRESGKLNIKIFDITGKLLMHLQEDVSNSGLHEISLKDFNISNKAGIYVLEIESDAFNAVQKIVKY